MCLRQVPGRGFRGLPSCAVFSLDIRRIADLLLGLERPGAALIAAPQQPGDVAG